MLEATLSQMSNCKPAAHFKRLGQSVGCSCYLQTKTPLQEKRKFNCIQSYRKQHGPDGHVDWVPIASPIMLSTS
uniref:Uncharacterized protein n=1 Tax=Populus trichocarpa TaxID=3694 RepID=A0A3N7FGW2_POPTR